MLIGVAVAALILAVFRWNDWPGSSALVCFALVIYGVWLAPNARRRFLAILGCMYLPYAWLLWDDYPWSDYRWSWIGMWPILPGIIPGYFFHQYETVEFACMSLVTLLCATIAGFIAARGRWLLAATAFVVLALSMANAYFAYALFLD